MIGSDLSFQLSLPLVILAGQGSDMLVLLKGEANPKGLASLPRIIVQSSLHPKLVAQQYLAEMGPQVAANELHPLELRGFTEYQSQRYLSQAYLVWRPHFEEISTKLHWQHLAQIDQFSPGDGALVCDALAKFWQRMPSANLALRGITPFGGVQNDDSQAIFFGGSFNPWHRGHQACIELCPESAKVVVVPDANPRKQIQNPVCSWRLYRALIERVSKLGARVFPGYGGLEHPNPSVGWLPHTHFERRQLLIGDDSLVTLAKWIQAKRLVTALDHIWVAPRLSRDAAIQNAVTWLSVNAPECGLTFLGDHPYRDVSSTVLRQQAHT